MDMGAKPRDAAAKIELAKEYSRVVMQIVVSLVMLTTCLVLWSHSPSQDVQKACTGFIGTIVGYWLR